MARPLHPSTTSYSELFDGYSQERIQGCLNRVLNACSNMNRLYFEVMTKAVAQILKEVEQLSVPERAELADRIAESLASVVPSNIGQKKTDEARRRISEIEAGEVALIPGEEALARFVDRGFTGKPESNG